jgi:segregation and condensation protein B
MNVMESMSKISSISALLEAILFASSEPRKPQALAKQIGCDESAVAEGLASLKHDLSDRGIALVESRSGFELAVAPKFRNQADAPTAEATPSLSQSSLEVMTIVAYDGPCTKLAIDEIRATPSDNSLRALLSRDLIEQLKPDKASGGNPRYELTSFAWRCLGITGRNNLPPKPKQKRATDAIE